MSEIGLAVLEVSLGERCGASISTDHVLEAVLELEGSLVGVSHHVLTVWL